MFGFDRRAAARLVRLDPAHLDDPGAGARGGVGCDRFRRGGRFGHRLRRGFGRRVEREGGHHGADRVFEVLHGFRDRFGRRSGRRDNRRLCREGVLDRKHRLLGGQLGFGRGGFHHHGLGDRRGLFNILGQFGVFGGTRRAGMVDGGTDALQLGGDAFGGGRHGCSGGGGADGGRFHDGGGRGGERGRRSLGPQHDAMFLNLRLDPALDLALGDAVQHVGIGGGRFGAEVAIIGRKVAEVFGNCLHRREWLVEPLQRAGEGSVRYREDLACTDHRKLAF